MKKAIIKQIGEEAIDKKDRMLILFNEGATSELKKVSVIQEFSNEESSIELEKGGKISIDETDYQIEKVGHLATKQLNTIGHITMIFDDVPAERDVLSSAVYLSPALMPKISQGSVIYYH